MRYFKRIFNDYMFCLNKIYKENDICEEPKYNTLVKDSVRRHPNSWKEVSEIEYIKQEGWCIRGSDEFVKWVKEHGFDLNNCYGNCSDYEYTIIDGKVDIVNNSCYKKDQTREIEVTVDQLNEIYNIKSKEKEMANFQVKVTPTTSKILQELAFENGYSWSINQTKVSNLNGSPLCFEPRKGRLTYHDGGFKQVSLEEAINRITTKESFKEGDWIVWKGSDNTAYRITKVDNFGFNVETDIPRLGRYNDPTFQYVRKATDEEIQSALIKEAKRRGFPAKRWNSPDVCLQFNSKLNDSWTYNREQDKLRNNGGLVYEKGEWAEIVDEPKEIFGFPVDYTEAGLVQFGCSNHRYTINELERFISTLRNVKAQTTVGELLSELRDVLKY